MKAKVHKICLRPLPPSKCMNKMINLFKNVSWYIIEGACTVLLYMLKYVPAVQQVHDEAVVCRRSPLPEIYLICIKAKDVDIEQRFLPFVPDYFKTREMCDKAVRKYPWLLQFVPDWFVTQ